MWKYKLHAILVLELQVGGPPADRRVAIPLTHNHTQCLPNLMYELSIFLYRTLATGLVLTVDDDKKCVGVVVWQAPRRKLSLVERVSDWCLQAGFDVWNGLNNLYYGGSGFNHSVAP